VQDVDIREKTPVRSIKTRLNEPEEIQCLQMLWNAIAVECIQDDRIVAVRRGAQKVFAVRDMALDCPGKTKIIMRHSEGRRILVDDCHSSGGLGKHRPQAAAAASDHQDVVCLCLREQPMNRVNIGCHTDAIRIRLALEAAPLEVIEQTLRSVFHHFDLAEFSFELRDIDHETLAGVLISAGWELPALRMFGILAPARIRIG